MGDKPPSVEQRFVPNLQRRQTMNMTVDKRTFALGVLTLSAVILLVANILAPRGAVAMTTVFDKETYQMQTGRVSNGGEALYVTDNRTGMMGVFVYDPNRHSVVLVARRPVMDAFGVVGPQPGRNGRMNRP
jgi:hypothetical protein